MAGKSAVTLRLGAEGNDKIIAALKKIGETGDQAFAGLSREAKAAARDFDRLEKSLDGQARSAAQVASTYVKANAAVAAGVRTQADAQRVLDLATERHRRLTGAVNDNARAAGLARHEWINLSRQFQDVGVSLAGGQSPLTVLLQQGSQIADIFGSSQAGAGGALRAFGATATRVLFSPIGAAVGLAAAVFGVKVAGDAAAESLAKLGEEARQTALTSNRLTGAKIVGARAGLDDKDTVSAFANAQKEFEAFSRNSGQVKDILEKVDKGFLKVLDSARGSSEWIDKVNQEIRKLPTAQGLSLAKALFGDEAGRKLFEEIQNGAVSMASLSKEAEKAGANFDASATHAEKMKREIAEAENIASTKLLSVFGDLAEPSLAISRSWASTKINIADAVKAARELINAPAIRRAAQQREGALAGAEIGRLVTGKDPFAGKSFADVDPLINLFTQGKPPRTVGEDRKLFESTNRPRGGGKSAAQRFTDIEADLKNRISLAASEGTAHDEISLKIKIENEQRKLGTKATQEQKDEVAALVTQLDAAERAQKKLTEAGKEYADALKEVGDLTKGFLRDLQNGDGFAKALGSTLKSIQGKAIDKGVDAGIGALGNAFKSSGGGFFDSIGSSLKSLWPFEDGGVMTSAEPLPLRRYSGGGIADSPQLAMFGEGRMPEAFVPLPDGRSIPVAMRGGAPKITINNNAAVDVTPRVMSDGEIILHVERRIAQSNKQRDEAPHAIEPPLMRDPLADFLGLDGVEASIRRVIDTTALLAAKQPEGVRAAAVAWFRNELVDGLSGKEEFRGKDLGVLADALAERLVKRINEIEASEAGRA